MAEPEPEPEPGLGARPGAKLGRGSGSGTGTGGSVGVGENARGRRRIACSTSSHFIRLLGQVEGLRPRAERAAPATGAPDLSCGGESSRGSLERRNPHAQHLPGHSLVRCGRRGAHDAHCAPRSRPRAAASARIGIGGSELRGRHVRSRAVSNGLLQHLTSRDARELRGARGFRPATELSPLTAELEDRIQRILGTLYRLSFPGRVAR
jgi:hypothetical protein